MIRAVGFDFDGTLIMSEDKKASAMAKVFKEKFGVKRGIEQAYEKLIGNGYNRDAKVKHLFEKFLKRKPTSKELKTVSEHFGEHYEKSLTTCPLFECSNIVKEINNKVKFTFLLSLENKKEVGKIAKHCGVAKYFNEILSGPASKIDNFLHVCNKHNIKPSEMLYIGDSLGDVKAAKKVKMKVAIVGKKNKDANFVYKSLCDRKISELLG